MQLIRAAFLEGITDPEKLPVTYKLDGVQYKGIPAEFNPTAVRRIIDANIVERTYTGLVPETGLSLRVETFEYKDCPVFEWTAFFTNNGSDNSPVISDFFGCDAVLPGAEGVTLFHNNGDYCNRAGLETTEKVLEADEIFEQKSANGRSCDRAWPYYRILTGDYGYNMAIGWPGNWHSYISLAEGGILFKAKQECTNFYLKPGETARSPRITAMAFEGGSDRGINMWRKFYFDHLMSRSRGSKLAPKMCFSYNGGGEEFTLASEENQKWAINKFIERGAVPDIWWIDAGWYPCKDEKGESKWVRTGKWYPDPERFPNGLGPIGKLCDDNAIQFLLWFEPERVMLNFWPEGLPEKYVLKLQVPKNNAWLDGNGLLNLGDEECRKWFTDKVKNILHEGGVKIYRQDFNGDPFPVAWWLENDLEPNRSGITENKHIQGYLQYWDDLLIDTPDLWIDSCASGGRRNDTEAMRRAVTLHPTDYGYGEHPVKQAFQKTWFEWTPYFRSLTSSWDDEDGNYNTEKPRIHGYDSYAGHCGFAPVTCFGAGVSSAEPEFNNAKNFRALWQKAAEYTIDSDYFCLTAVRKSNEDFFVQQFYKEDTKTGLIQVIRNTRCEEESITVFPKAFEDGLMYVFEAPETGEMFTKTGKEINTLGLTFALPKRSGKFWFYKVK